MTCTAETALVKSLGPVSPLGRSGYRRVILTASVKFDVDIGFASLYQAWKFHCSPGTAATKEAGVGSIPRSIDSVISPISPEDVISPVRL